MTVNTASFYKESAAFGFFSGPVCGNAAIELPMQPPTHPSISHAQCQPSLMLEQALPGSSSIAPVGVLAALALLQRTCVQLQAGAALATFLFAAASPATGTGGAGPSLTALSLALVTLSWVVLANRLFGSSSNGQQSPPSTGLAWLALAAQTTAVGCAQGLCLVGGAGAGSAPAIALAGTSAAAALAALAAFAVAGYVSVPAAVVAVEVH